MLSVSTPLLHSTIADASQLNERIHASSPIIQALQDMLDRESRPYDGSQGLVSNRQLYEIQSLLFFNPASHRVLHQGIAASLAANAQASSGAIVGRQHRMETKAWKLSPRVKDRAKQGFEKRRAAIKEYKAFQR